MDQESPDAEVPLSKDDDAIAADWARISEKYAVKDEPEVTPSAAENAPVAEQATPPIAAERPRAADGKFVPKPAQEPQAPQPAATDSSSLAAAQVAAGGADASITTAPSSWKPAAKAVWAAIAPEVQAEIHRRENDFLKGQSGLLPDAQFGKSIRDKAAPYQQLIQAEGTTVDAAFDAYLQQSATLRTGTPEQKAQMIAQGIRQFGVPVELLNQALAGNFQAPQQFKDPRLDQFFAQQEEQKTADVLRVIEDFSAEKDAKGQPLRPYVANVEGEMNSLIPQIKSSNPQLSNKEVLTEAYNRAVWANPETRVLLEQQRFTELEAERAAKKASAVAEAKKAASVNVPKRGFTNRSAPKKSIESTIEDTARELGLMN